MTFDASGSCRHWRFCLFNPWRNNFLLGACGGFRCPNTCRRACANFPLKFGLPCCYIDQMKLPHDNFVHSEFIQSLDTYFPWEVCSKSVTRVEIPGVRQLLVRRAFLNSSSQTTCWANLTWIFFRPKNLNKLVYVHFFLSFFNFKNRQKLNINTILMFWEDAPFSFVPIVVIIRSCATVVWSNLRAVSHWCTS